MIIGVDAGCLSVSDNRLKVGVYRMTLALLRALLTIDKKNYYYFYSFSPLNKKLFSDFRNSKNIVVVPKTGWFSFWLPKRLNNDEPDLFLGFSQSLPKLPKLTKGILFIHDLTFEKYPKFFPNSYNKMSKNTTNAIKRADIIIAVSKATKIDMIKKYNIAPDKIQVIYEGYDDRFKKITFGVAQKRLQKVGIKDPFFLFVGTLKQSKNIPNIIRAFYRFQKDYKNYKLILAGSNYWLDPEIPEVIKRLKIENAVKNLGFVDDSLLEALYTKATAFISPAYNEGFGLTYVEAANFNLPVIASNRGSVKEVIGNGVLYVDPNNISEILGGLKTVLSNNNLVKKITKLASQSIVKFSYKKSAKKLLRIINSYEK